MFTSKSKHQPLATDSRLIVTQPGDVIVENLMGTFPVSFNKGVYALIVKDHLSFLEKFYLLRQKSDATPFIVEWIEKFNNLTKFKVKQLCTDNGGEFSSWFLNDTLQTRGIVHETTIPCKHHESGKIEQTNKKIVEAARSMLINPNLGPELWTHTFWKAICVFNCLLHRKATKTLYELVAGK
ncbi:hypothetical protein O181_120465 [Austropuccinia psidii MF-1]|uniref:Integrase catalytic domain-containing protein n=1 Tax=Austropuccinia psidii MF-1 TaxID=1389203 RepID=A0A9Q3KK79_9BASI|nr:hypothetical protein [Austropuccinia psidii MF-1]